MDIDEQFIDASVQTDESFGDNVNVIRKGHLTRFVQISVSDTETKTQVNHDDDVILKDAWLATDGSQFIDEEEENNEEEERNEADKEENSGFCGYASVKKENQVQQLTSVADPVFDFLLDMLHDFKPRSRTKQDYLLMFLLKLKYGLPFRALSILFHTKESTLSDNFYAILERLFVRSKILWPSREKVQRNMPSTFKEHFSNCRVIIDCTEVKTERLSRTDSQFIMYSNYKGTHTIKVLVGNIALRLL